MLSLQSEKQSFFLIPLFKIERVKTGVTITDDFLKVEANLGDLNLSDPSDDTFYKNIVHSAGSGDVLSLEMTNFNRATADQESMENMKNVDTSVFVKVVYYL